MSKQIVESCQKGPTVVAEVRSVQTDEMSFTDEKSGQKITKQLRRVGCEILGSGVAFQCVQWPDRSTNQLGPFPFKRGDKIVAEVTKWLNIKGVLEVGLGEIQPLTP